MIRQQACETIDVKHNMFGSLMLTCSSGLGSGGGGGGPAGAFFGAMLRARVLSALLFSKDNRSGDARPSIDQYVGAPLHS